MSEQTKIEWCDHTWNPWEGCTKVSPGCAHCYAEARNHRFGNDNWGKGKPRRRTVDWKKPVKWNADAWRFPYKCPKCGVRIGDPDLLGSPFTCDRCKMTLEMYRPRVFPSLCDIWDTEVPIYYLGDCLKLIRDTPNLDWLLLTKRPENCISRLVEVMQHIEDTSGNGDLHEWILDWASGKPPTNVWLGVSVENQEYANRRIPELLKIPARVRFLSVEPMLGPVQLDPHWLGSGGRSGENYQQPQVNWVIIGGESGPGARPCNVDWIRDGVKQCRAVGVPVFVKQLGAKPKDTNINLDYCIIRGYGVTNNTSYNKAIQLKLKDKKGGDPAEWPEDLRVREFPKL